MTPAQINSLRRFYPCPHASPARRRRFLRSSSSTALRGRPEQASASAEGTAVSVVEEPAEPEELPEFIAHDAVSYWVHPGKESNIWLVGTIHQTAPSVKVRRPVSFPFSPCGRCVVRHEITPTRVDRTSSLGGTPLFFAAKYHIRRMSVLVPLAIPTSAM